MKENNVRNIQFFNKEKRMKKTLILTALVAAFVLSLTAVAGARYDGFYAGGPHATEAYLRWADAQAAWQRNTGDPTADQGTAHGNYRTTTAKCFVCHSAHRAYSQGPSTSLASAINANRGLVEFGAGNACITCHATAGATGATKQIEWGTMYGNTVNNGPHEDFGCTGRCHAGGIHGWSASDFHGMNVWLLGGESDAEMHADFANGNANSIMRRVNMTGMPGIANNANLGVTTHQRTNFAYYPDGTTGYYGYALNNTALGSGPFTFGPAWFQFGPDSVPANGMAPASMWAGTYQPETVFAAARATATGYTCGRAGCHVSGNFAVNTWGFGKNRAGDPDDPATMTTAMTGHATGAWGYGSNRTGCAPCHPGGAGGGYRYFPGDLYWDRAGINDRGQGFGTNAAPGTTLSYFEVMAQIGTTRTYGCNQCHDMIGVATNRPAWPHGNRNIQAWEWTNFDNIERDGWGRLPRDTWIASRVATNVDEGNLWMYSANIGRIVAGIPINNSGGSLTAPAPGQMGGNPPAGFHPEQHLYGITLNWQEDLLAADPTWTIIYGVGDSGVNAGMTGEIQDGTCLKCHMATDSMSAQALAMTHNETAMPGHEVTVSAVTAVDIASRWHQARRNTTDGWQNNIFNGGRNGVRPITNPADPNYNALWNTVERNTGVSSKYMFLFR